MTENIFQEALTTIYADILEHAVTHNYLVCVPNPGSISKSQITRRFISNSYSVDHMIKASPYIHNLFQTMTGKNLIITNNEIKAHTGYTHKFALQIIKEENAHDQKGRMFKQIFVTAPLDDNPNKCVMMKPDPIYKFQSAKEYIGYLQCAVEDSEAAFKFAQVFVEHFNTSYIIFKQFAQEAYNKVKSALSDLKTLILKIEQFREVPQNASYVQCLNEMVESNILHEIYNKLFSHIVEFNQEQEQVLLGNYERLLALPMAARFGFDQELEGIQFRDSVEVFSTINDFKTPWEKLEVLCKLAFAVEKECKKYLFTVNVAKAEKWDMSADQYFPLLIYFLAKSRPKNLQANLMFITEFCVGQAPGGKLYHLTNLMAAVQTVGRMVEETSSFLE